MFAYLRLAQAPFGPDDLGGTRSVHGAGVLVQRRHVHARRLVER